MSREHQGLTVGLQIIHYDYDDMGRPYPGHVAELLAGGKVRVRWLLQAPPCGETIHCSKIHGREQAFERDGFTVGEKVRDTQGNVGYVSSFMGGPERFIDVKVSAATSLTRRPEELTKI